MKNWLDLFLLDTILRTRKFNPYDWKGVITFLLTLLGAINLHIIGFWLKYYFQILAVPTLKVDLFPPNIYLVSMLNYVPGFCLLYGLPAFIVNYFLIFHKGRYLKLMRKYPEMKGDKYYPFMYLLFTIVFGIASFCIVYASVGPLH
jgi:hypothetical protein